MFSLKKFLIAICFSVLLFPLAGCSHQNIYTNSIRVFPEDDSDMIIRKAAMVIPTDRQYEWQKNEFIGFLHFGVNTFTGREWGTGTEDPSIFNPTDLNTDQWCNIIKEAGMKGAIITVKHHDGFCLWPSRYTDHSVKSCSWANGNGDIVGSLAASCKKYGLKLGLYLSPADLHELSRPDGLYGNGSLPHTSKIPSDPEHQAQVRKVFEYDNLTDYDIYFMNQLYELLTEYGDIFEVWFDGANPKPGTGQTYNYNAYRDLIRKLQPNAVIAIGGPDVRWCGNEAGRTRVSEFSVIPMSGNPAVEIKYEGNSPQNLAGRNKLFNAEYLYWYPAETNTTIRRGWFYRNEQQYVKPASELIDIWFRAVGGNSVMLLNLNPDRRGLIPDQDASNLLQLGRVVKETFAVNLISGASIKASSSKGSHRASKILDNREDTYWMAPEGQETAELVIDLKQEKTFNRLVMQEMIKTRGQRVESYVIEINQNGSWVKVVDGTVIGYKSIDRFPMVTTDKIRVRITGSRVCPTLNFMGIYKGPETLSEPVISRDKSGLVKISTVSPDVEIRYTLDGSDPQIDSPKYNGPFLMMNSGEIKVIAYVDEFQHHSSIISKSFGLCKSQWEILSASSATNKCLSADDLIDDNPKTVFSCKEEYPYSICVDMKKVLDVKGFTYLPPADSEAGIVDTYQFYISPDNKDWHLAASGKFANIKNNPIEQEVLFKNVQCCRYFKFVALSSVNPSKGCVISEIGILN